MAMVRTSKLFGVTTSSIRSAMIKSSRESKRALAVVRLKREKSKDRCTTTDDVARTGPSRATKMAMYSIM